jgi:hypothetical protein
MHEISAGLSFSVDDSQSFQQNMSYALVFPDLQEGNLIIMESARYAHGRQYNMRDSDGIRMIRLDSVRDKGDGWLMATYFQVS